MIKIKFIGKLDKIIKLLAKQEIELELKNEKYIVYFWDGYSLAETYETINYDDALSKYKKFAKKLAKNLRRY